MTYDNDNGEEIAEEDDDSDDEEEELFEEIIQQPGDEDLVEAPAVDERWFAKVAPFMEHVIKVSKRLYRHPGFALSIHEMMRQFKGRTIQTHRMKGKPTKEGYKFFALCCATTGFVYDFFPDGRRERSTIAENVRNLVYEKIEGWDVPARCTGKVVFSQLKKDFILKT
jgi:Transposase IS4